MKKKLLVLALMVTIAAGATSGVAGEGQNWDLGEIQSSWAYPSDQTVERLRSIPGKEAVFDLAFVLQERIVNYKRYKNDAEAKKTIEQEKATLTKLYSFNGGYEDNISSEINNYDGSAEAFVDILNSISYRDNIDLPCNWVQDSPVLVELSNPRDGGASAGQLPHPTGCDTAPESVHRLERELKQLGDPVHVPGTIASVIGAGARYTHDLLVFYPEHYEDADSRPDTSITRPNDPGQPELLGRWKLYSVWNFEKSKNISYLYRVALNDLEAYYRKLLKDRGEDVTLAQKDAIAALAAETAPYWSAQAKDDPRFAMLVLNTYPDKRSDLGTDVLGKDDLIGAPEPLSFFALEQPQFLPAFLNTASLYQKNEFGKTILMEAAHFNKMNEAISIVNTLSPDKRRAFVNEETNAPIAGEVTSNGGYAPEFSHFQLHHGRRTALMYAAENSSQEFLKFLLKEGADICAKDSEGLIAKDYLNGHGPANFVNPNINADRLPTAMTMLTCKD